MEASTTLTTLITGTRKGIGRSLAEYYIAKGHHVIGCSREASSLEHRNYEHHLLDISNESAVIEFITSLRRRNISISHLINNAGVAAMNHSLMTPGSTLQKIFEVNFFGTFFLCREVAKLMQLKKFGRVVNFSTVAVPLNLEGESIYASSKSAIEKLTSILGKELGPLGITVNAIGPTPIETDLIKAIPAEKIDKLIQMQSVKRLGTFDDIHNVIDFFLRPGSSFVTGQTIYLGGV